MDRRGFFEVGSFGEPGGTRSPYWFTDATFAAGGRVLAVDIKRSDGHEIGFYDLIHPDRTPKRVAGRHNSWVLSVSPDGGLVASTTEGGEVRLFDPAKGELIESLHGHLHGVLGMAFSADGRRLISASGGREAVSSSGMSALGRNC